MKIHILPYLIMYYFPHLATTMRKLKLLLKRGKIDVPIKANARYCYSVWLRRLAILNKNGLNTNPTIIAELGPGDSMGVGLMALLTGANKYYAFDVVKQTSSEQNVALFDELITLLLNQSDIPGEIEFPRVHPQLISYNYPFNILTKERLANCLYDNRINQIRDNLLQHENLRKEESFLHYFCPWYESSIIDKESVDMIYSQAALEHVDDLNNTYDAMYQWLKPGGVMSHQIDFKSHGTSKNWNGHWSYSDFEWKLIRGNKTYLINREPLSTHIDLLKKKGFKIISVIPVKTYPSEKYISSIQNFLSHMLIIH